ncbi:MAG TPA: hypothetical protein VGQ36_13740 [Thermoanaerobaculia bacterium]|jgi:hypothetical protein|nr:hypothetical protein [Thermoanaerobaculia bacterium]
MTGGEREMADSCPPAAGFRVVNIPWNITWAYACTIKDPARDDVHDEEQLAARKRWMRAHFCMEPRSRSSAGAIVLTNANP